MRFWFSKIANKAELYDVEKWQTVIKNDTAVAAVVQNLQPLGDKWVDEFARNYLSVNDKKHVYRIVEKIIDDARQERKAAHR